MARSSVIIAMLLALTNLVSAAPRPVQIRSVTATDGETGTDGELTCLSDSSKQPPTSNNAMLQSDAQSAIASFCSKAQGTFTDSSPFTYQFQAISFDIMNPANSSDYIRNPISVSAMWKTGATGCPVQAFGSKNGTAKCTDSLSTIVNSCDVNDTPQDPSTDYWKKGGKYYRDCITWSIQPQGSPALLHVAEEA